MLRLQVDDTGLLRDSQVGGRGAVEGELGSGIPQALLGLEGWEMLDFWVRGPSTARRLVLSDAIVETSARSWAS